MIRFGFFYHKGKLIVFDVTIDESQGYSTYVATLSDTPTVSFRAIRAEHAIERLMEYVEHGTTAPTLQKVTWTPSEVSTKEGRRFEGASDGRRTAAYPSW